MHIDIPDDLNRRLEQLAKGIGQDVGALVCEAIEQRLAIEEQKKRLQETSGQGRARGTVRPQAQSSLGQERPDPRPGDRGRQPGR